MWGFVPLVREEMQYLVGSLRDLIEPEFALIAEVEGKVAGAAIGLPDYNPHSRNQRAVVSVWISAATVAARPESLLRSLADRRAEYQRWGLGLVLLRALLPKALQLGFCEAEFSWISETNTLAIGGMRKAGLRHSKTFRMYDFGEAAIEEARPARADRAPGADNWRHA